MAQQPDELLWTQPDWLREAHEWIAQSLAVRGQTVSGPIEQVLARYWSTIMRVPVGSGVVYFKASLPLLAGEARLLKALHVWRPESVLPVIAENERGWMLIPDGGKTLRTMIHSAADLPCADPLMAQMAGLQIEMVDHVDELLALVPFDRRLDRLPGMFEALLEDAAALRIGREDGLSADQHRRLRAMVPRYRELCERLASFRIPHSLHHDDFHDNNVFVQPADCAGQYRIADWAESCVTHPFCSLLICLRSLSDRAGFPDEAADVPEALHPDLARLRDIYLAPWERFEPHDRLVEIFNLAWRVGMVNRALTWHEGNLALEPRFREEHAYAVPAWLGEFLALMERT